MVKSMEVCCEKMRYFSTLSCTDHSSIYDCPDVLISISNNHQIGLIVHDGGSSQIAINYCPWCGANLCPTGLFRRRIQSIEKKAISKLNKEGGPSSVA